ncbi:MAG: hypothetical protein A2016_11840 [Elusimicrobia bacterium GWF2_62_30]|nr:MAG: hypothetical protein A2016_11840 [Elusimicrobia bacterium GWF2_62_30]
MLAERLAGRGCDTVCLCAEGAEVPSGRGVSVERFSSFLDLDRALKRLLKARAFDAVIHLAAVSDYSPAIIEAGGKRFKPGRDSKIDSQAAEIKLVLKRNFKIIDRLKKYAAEGKQPEPLLIGFKLTSGAADELITKKVRDLGAADLVVHNDLAEMKKDHIFHVYKNGARTADCRGPEELAALLYAAVKEKEAVCS